MAEKSEIRLSQLIQTFGPGAIVDLPKSSVLVRSLSAWPTFKVRKIRERRLLYYLRKLLETGDGGTWLAEDAELELWEPPLNEESLQFGDAPTVPAVVFPRWMTVSSDRDREKGGNKVRLEKFNPNERSRKKETKTPIRWIAACKNGHVRDINWRWFVHVGTGRDNCQQDLFIEDTGSGSDPQYIHVSCECGARRSLKDLYASPDALGSCNGSRPWIRRGSNQECGESLKPMTRGAINNYYSQILSLIALDEDPDDIDQIIERFPSLKGAQSQQEVEIAMRLGGADLRQALQNYSIEEIWQSIQNLQNSNASEGDDLARAPNPKEAEFEAFTAGDVIGRQGINSRLTGRRLERDSFQSGSPIDLGFLQDIVALDRMCVVTALYGFTRLEPAPSPFDENFEEITLQVRGQPLDDKISWLPAMEQFGEGFFLRINTEWLRDSISNPDAEAAFDLVQARYEEWRSKQPGNRSPYPGNAYVFAHSLSHMLMEQIALEAGYPSTSLSERIYALAPMGSSRISKVGVLIYAAGGGSQGTLGGLLRQAMNIPGLVARGLDRIEICGNDPICSTTPTPIANDDFSGFGASCHGCLFTAETSCEKRNMLLDRLGLLALLRTSLRSKLTSVGTII